MFTEENINTFKTLCKAREQSILSVMSSFLKTKYTNVERTPAYVLAEGNIPVALVAHADTVFKNPPKTFFYDQECMVIWSPEGMGADDRAGIYAIMEIIKHSNLRPHVIITTGEESGCIGASKLVGHYKFPYELKCLIQLDRRGSNDCVFYDCDNEQFEKFVESFGFVTDWGSLSDISILAPAWGVAAANLSVGYYNEHTRDEYLQVNEWYRSIQETIRILEDAERVHKFEYIEDVYDYSWLSSFGKIDFCESCGKPSNDIYEVVMPDGDILGFCLNCIADNDLQYCPDCQSFFVPSRPGQTKCYWCERESLQNNK